MIIRKLNNKKLLCIVFLLCAKECVAVSLTTEEVVAKLTQLKPLPKVHYSWGWPRELLEDANGRLLYETARIMNAISLSGRSATKEQIHTAVYTCARINKTNPVISLTIGVNYSPFHYELGPNVPPTYRGSTYQKELQRFESRLIIIKNWIEESNAYYKSSVIVGAILLDMERFYVQPGNEKWNEGMRDALDTVHAKTEKIYPEAKIIWYARGITWKSNDPPWRQSPHFTGKEKLSSLSCSLYSLPEIERMLETYRRTVKLADKLKVNDVVPYVSLASGYRRGLKDTFWYDFDWDYDLIYSYLFGQYINNDWYGKTERGERFAPFSRTNVVDFYPPPFDPRTPQWGKHFIAYVRGASSIKELSDLGHEEKNQ